MSGIVGSAGSKSGVIGTTELDYEEGFHTTVVGSSGGGSTTYDSTAMGYTKIGNQVFCNGLIGLLDPSGLSDGAFTLTLPFLSSASAGHRSGCYILVEGNATSNLADYVGAIGTSASILTVYLGDNIYFQADSANQANVNTGFFLSFFYTTDL